MGVVKAVCISEKRGTEKKNIGSAVFIEGYGIEGDAHAGSWHRQVSLLSYEKIQDFNAKGGGVSDGDFGENIVADGFDFRTLPVGTKLKCNDVVLEITQIGKECHSHCTIYRRVGECIMPKEGVFARVLHGGRISVGDELIRIEDGGKEDFFVPRRDRYRAAVITVSDKGYAGERADLSGPAAEKLLREAGYEIVDSRLLPDGIEPLAGALMELCDQGRCDLIITTGGTGFSERDLTPEATAKVCERNAPGIAEALRAYSSGITKRAMFGRGASVIRKKTLIVNLPGSAKAVKESLEFLLPQLAHGLGVLTGSEKECGNA